MTVQNSSATSSSGNRHKLAVVAVVLGAVLFLAVNIFSNATFRAKQLDLTEGHLYTLSDATREVLAKVDEPITARLYFSRFLGEQSPPHARYYERVRELLEQYSNLTEGRFHLQMFNPEPFSDDEDSAVSYGLTGIPLNDSGDLGYFGLAASNSTDDHETIPFFTPERESFLEYDLTKLVLALATPKKPVVGVLSTLPINGGFLPGAGQRPRWTVIEQINEFFEVQPIAPDVPVIGDDVSILMLVHPKNLPAKTQYAIDQFAMRGGKVLAFVDPASEVDKPPRGMQPPGRSDLADVLKTWGVELRKDKVAGDLDTARRVNIRAGAQVAVADYVGWLSLRPGNFDREDGAMADLQMINVGTAGILDTLKDATTKVTPLIHTGMRSMAIDASKFAGQPDVIGLFRSFKAGSEPLTLAARISGPVKSAFPDGPPEDPDGKLKPKHLAQSKSDLQAIVVADVDMLHDQLWVDVQDLLGQRLLVPFANNGDFVISALENLAGGASLNELRGRTVSNRPFHLVREIRQAAERRFRDKEEELQKQLDGVRADLNKMIRRENIQAGGELILRPEDRAKIDEARTKMVALRKELRNVQHELRKDIDNLDSWLKFFNIAAIPLLLGLGTLIFVLARRLRRRGGVVETG
jgi:ABC-type uncharacterized transport system involved in gliding motility auxiliary subunit